MRRTIPLLLALFALLPATAQARSVPHGFFGVMTDGALMTRDDASLAHEFALMKASGVETVRPVVYWADLQPTQDGPLATAGLDRIIGEAAKNGMRVVPVVLRTPAWARIVPSDMASPPKDPQDFAAFMKLLVARYGPSGTFWSEHPEVPVSPQHDWQIWNEPNLDRYWSSPTPFGKGYVALLKAARTAIKRADPQSRIILCGFGNASWTALAAAYKAGLKGSMFDIAATHPFSARVSNVLKIVGLNRQVMARNGDARKPIDISEMTWASAQGGPATDIADFSTTRAGQASKLTAAYKALIAKRKAWRINSVVWSTWLSSDGTDGSINLFDWSGLRRLNPADPAGEPISKPALAAYAKLARASER
ncbi:MAG: endo,4-beta-xylanase [Solirubrobacterales bacterium]|nr:endo,4-beta-xylanase [Solirubrobacterales bacterium]